MDLQKAIEAKTLLEEINKLQKEFKNFEPNYEQFRIYFANDVPDQHNSGIYKVDLHTSLDQDEFDKIIQYIRCMINNKIDNLKNKLNEL